MGVLLLIRDAAMVKDQIACNARSELESLASNAGELELITWSRAFLCVFSIKIEESYSFLRWNGMGSIRWFYHHD